MNRGKLIKRIICIMLILGMIVSCRMPMGSAAKTVLKKTSITSVKETSNATVTIKWKKIASANGYIIYRKKSVAGSFKKIATIKKNKTTSYVDKKTEDGTIYYYSIKTYKGKKKSAYCTKKKVTTSRPEIGTLSSSSTGISSDKPRSVTFEVQVKNTKRIKKDSLALYENGSLKSYLVDGGSDGKDKLNDGYYSNSVAVSGQPGTKYTYYVKYKKTQTNEETVTVYEPITTDNLSVVSDSKTAISSVIDDKNSDKGNVNAVYNLAKEWESRGKLSSVSVTSNCVSMVFPNGIHYVYMPQNNKLNAGGGEVSISTYQPYYHFGDKNHPLYDNPIPDESANKVSNTISTCSFDRNYDGQEVTLDRINEFGENQFIIWNGHGGYNQDGPFLLIGEHSSQKALLESDDYVSGAIMICYDASYVDEDTLGRLAVSGKYFQNHLGSMENSFVFFESCHTSQQKLNGEYDDRLLGEFTRMGASAIAFSSSVYSAYATRMLEAWVSEMISINQGSKMYNTAYEALSSALSSVGDNDSVIGGLDDEHPSYAFPVLWGNQDYRFSDVCQADLKLDCTEKTLNADESFTLTAETEADGKYLNWSVNGTSFASISGSGKTITVIGKNPGEATITCSIGDKSASCKITVIGMKTLGKDNLTNNPYYVHYMGWLNNNNIDGKVKISGSWIYLYNCSLYCYQNNEDLPTMDYRIKLRNGVKIHAYVSEQYGKPQDRYWSIKEFNKAFYKNGTGNGLSICLNIKSGIVNSIELGGKSY